MIWLLPSLCPWIFYKIFFHWEGSFTINALIWLLSKLFLKSFCKYLGMLEKCIPIDALVWFLLSMCLLVFHKMIILGKKLFPINNLVWFPLTSDWYWFFSASFQRFFTHIQLYDYFLSQKCIDMASHQCVFFNVYITFCVFWWLWKYHICEDI